MVQPRPLDDHFRPRPFPGAHRGADADTAPAARQEGSMTTVKCAVAAEDAMQLFAARSGIEPGGMRYAAGPVASVMISEILNWVSVKANSGQAMEAVRRGIGLFTADRP